VTGDYNIKKSVDSQSQTRYRGIPLYDFLSSTDIGLKPNADQVIVTCSDNTSYTFTLADVYKSDYINGQNEAVKNLKIILAYGSAAVTNPDPEDGKPLVQLKTTEAGYDDAYGNSGGPIRLVVGQTGADDINSSRILKDVTSVELPPRKWSVGITAPVRFIRIIWRILYSCKWSTVKTLLYLTNPIPSLNWKP
jgi:hypothetical protein